MMTTRLNEVKSVNKKLEKGIMHEFVNGFVSRVEALARERKVKVLDRDKFVEMAEFVLSRDENYGKDVINLYRLYKERFFGNGSILKELGEDFVKGSFYTALMIASERIKVPEVLSSEVVAFLKDAEKWFFLKKRKKREK
jgi:hypothetical protein